MKIHNCFPTFIWELEILVPENFPKYCIDISQKTSSIKASNQCGSWHSGYNLHEDKFFYSNYLEYFLKHLSFLPNFRVENCWINVNPKHSFNTLHAHPGSDLSLVWYVQTSKDCGDIEFLNPNFCLRTKLIDFFEEEFLEKNYNNETCTFSALTNRCYIFPSDLLHLVNENKSDSLRISMSANLNFYI